MVKGISRQVIVVRPPEAKLFDQAIFILRDDAVGVTQEALIKEAERLAREPGKRPGRGKLAFWGPVWACAGAFATALVWIISSMV